MNNQHIHLEYWRDPKFKYYHLQNQADIDFPPIIKLEETIFKERLKSYYVLRGKSGKWHKKIISGIFQVDFRSNWYYGDHLVNGIKNYFLLTIDSNLEIINIYYFPGFYPRDSNRISFTYQFLYELKRAGN